MKLVKQTRLLIRQGKSEKVYEVDLCELGDDVFVVNFRYGRRGATLREGTKTTRPVSKAEGERVFDELVRSRVAKGYSESAPAPASKETRSEPLTAEEKKLQSEAILDRLRNPDDSQRRWRLSRAIWRAGELEIVDAEPLLHALVGRDTMTDYCIVWTMARLRQRNSAEVLERIANSDSAAPHVKHLATYALRMIADESGRRSLVSQAIQALPEPLRSLLKHESGDGFVQAFTDGIGAQYDSSLLAALQYIDNEICRRALLLSLEKIPLVEPNFRTLRRVFKVAELRRDGQVFGLLSYRFEKSEPGKVQADGGRGGFNAKATFGINTKHYLRRRVWRTLDRLGADASPDFVPMAVGVLLAFSDEDAAAPRTQTHYDWRSRSYTYQYWDPFANY